MKKEIINVALSFGAIALMVFLGTFSYQQKDTLYTKIEQYENLAYEYQMEAEQIVLEHNRKELEEQLAAEQKEKEIQEQLAAENALKLNQQQAALVQKQQDAAAAQVTIDRARQQQLLADQLVAQQALQKQLAAQKAAATPAPVKKPTRTSRAS